MALVGNARDPLNFDGIDGRLTLDAPKPQELLAIAGVTRQIDSPLTLAGTFKHDGGLWQLNDADGTLGGAPLKASLQLQEGGHHSQDAVTVDTALQKLDLNALLHPAAWKQPADETSLLVDPEPGALLDLHIAAGHIAYRTIEADKFDLRRSWRRAFSRSNSLRWISRRFGPFEGHHRQSGYQGHRRFRRCAERGRRRETGAADGLGQICRSAARSPAMSAAT